MLLFLLFFLLLLLFPLFMLSMWLWSWSWDRNWPLIFSISIGHCNLLFMFICFNRWHSFSLAYILDLLLIFNFDSQVKFYLIIHIGNRESRKIILFLIVFLRNWVIFVCLLFFNIILDLLNVLKFGFFRLIDIIVVWFTADINLGG